MTCDLEQPPSRREARREARRDAILDVAAESFLEKGYAGTAMSAIAATLGGSKGTLWSYFPSKEELFAAVIERLAQSFRAQLSMVLSPDQELETALHQFCREFLMRVTSPQAIALNRLVVGEANRFPEMGRIFYDRAPLATQILLGEFLSQAMDRSLLRRDNPLHAAQHLTSLCMSGTHQRLLTGVLEAATMELIEAEAERAMRTFLHGFAPSA